jgi:RNA 3'-terminal phosphate cyclase (ATP)
MIRIGAGELEIANPPGSESEWESSALRTALALSCATGARFRWDGFRRLRKRAPGFRPIDAESIQLFAQLSSARTEAGGVGDAHVEFAPEGVRPGEHRFDLSPAESMCPLVRLAALPLLATASGRTESTLCLSGSTHEAGGDTFELTSSTFGYCLRRLGMGLDLELACTGFAPRGGGEVVMRVAAGSATAEPPQHKGLDLVSLEPLKTIQIVSGGASLPAHVQQRQAARARSGARIAGVEPTVQLLKLRARSAGSVVAVTGLFGDVPITMTSVSERGKSAEHVGEQAAAKFRQFANQTAVVPELLVDSLLPFLALVDGASQLTTPRLPATTHGHARLVEAFTGRRVVIDGSIGQRGMIRLEANREPAGP